MVDGIDKNEMEGIIINSFLNSYNSLHNSDFKIEARQERPDYIIKSNNPFMMYGVEVTIAIPMDADNRTAKQLFQRSEMLLQPNDLENKPSEKIQEKAGRPVNIMEFVTLVNDCISKKLIKAANYSKEYKLILLIGAGFPCFKKTSYEQLVIPHIKRDNYSPFTQAWLLTYFSLHNEPPGLIKL